MRVTQVEFQALFNLGDYNNERIGITAQLEEGDTAESVIPSLREKVIELAANKGMGDTDAIYRHIWDQQVQLKKLETQIAEATEQWNQTAEFLRAQGIKPDSPSLPVFKALPQAADQELVGEFVENDSPF